MLVLFLMGAYRRAAGRKKAPAIALTYQELNGVGELTERQQTIAAAVVAEHIRTAQPVGSEVLRATAGFGCSSATIRNEMVRLERQGYLEQPHTSAGRVPLGPAYRLYVDGLRMTDSRLDRDMTWIQGELRRVAGQPEAALRLSSAILSRITRYPAVVVAPSGGGPRLIDLSLSPVSATNVLLSWLDDRGSSEEALIEIAAPITANEVARIEGELRGSCVGRPLDTDFAIEGLDAAGEDLLRGIREAFDEAGSGQVYVEGTTYILDQPEFEELERLRRLIGTLNQSPLLRRALGAAARGQTASASIGEEHNIGALRDCSVVAASYSAGGLREGALGVVGPMRMRYSQALEMVAAIARHLSQALARDREQ